MTKIVNQELLIFLKGQIAILIDIQPIKNHTKLLFKLSEQLPINKLQPECQRLYKLILVHNLIIFKQIAIVICEMVDRILAEMLLRDVVDLSERKGTYYSRVMLIYLFLP